MLCDGWNQCGDWEDEVCSCTPEQFLCFQKCIASTELCAGQLLCGTGIWSWSDDLEECDCKTCWADVSYVFYSVLLIIELHYILT